VGSVSNRVGELQLKKVCFGILALCFLGSATTAAAAELKPYLGLGVGSFNVKYSERTPLGNLDMSGETWGAFLKGGVQYGDYVGMELRAGTTGNVSSLFPPNTIGNAAPLDLKIGSEYQLSYLFKPQYPVKERLSVYALLGGTMAKFLTKSSGGVQQSASTWKTGFTYGLGLEYQFRLNGSLAIEWVQYWTDVDMAITNAGRSKASIRGASLLVNKFF